MYSSQLGTSQVQSNSVKSMRTLTIKMASFWSSGPLISRMQNQKRKPK